MTGRLIDPMASKIVSGICRTALLVPLQRQQGYPGASVGDGSAFRSFSGATLPCSPGAYGQWPGSRGGRPG
jgi:hypothetical protein